MRGASSFRVVWAGTYSGLIGMGVLRSSKASLPDLAGPVTGRRAVWSLRCGILAVVTRP